MRSTPVDISLLLLSLIGLTSAAVVASSSELLPSSATQSELFVAYENLQPLSNRPQYAGRPGARDFHLGYQQPGSALARRVTVRTANETFVQNIFVPGEIAFVEARDQTNGTGGYVRYYTGGVQEAFVQLHFRAVAGAVADTHFVVDVWAFPSADVRASEFRRGELNDRTVLDFTTVFDYPGDENHTIISGLRLYGSPEEKFTYIETFDLSDDENGGYIMMPGEFGNSSSMFVLVTSVAANMPINVSMAVYAETRENGGSPFRLGTYRAGLELLDYDYLNANAVEGERVTGTVTIAVPNSTIVFVQAKDRVPNGTSELVEISAGGLNSDSLTMVIRSGVGEPLEFRFDVYGVQNA